MYMDDILVHYDDLPSDQVIEYGAEERGGGVGEHSRLEILAPDPFDQRLGRVEGADGLVPGNAVFTAQDKGSQNLYFAPLNGAVRQVTTGTHMLSVTEITAYSPGLAPCLSPISSAASPSR